MCHDRNFRKGNSGEKRKGGMEGGRGGRSKKGMPQMRRRQTDCKPFETAAASFMFTATVPQYLAVQRRNKTDMRENYKSDKAVGEANGRKRQK